MVYTLDEGFTPDAEIGQVFDQTDGVAQKRIDAAIAWDGTGFELGRSQSTESWVTLDGAYSPTPERLSKWGSAYQETRQKPQRCHTSDKCKFPAPYSVTFDCNNPDAAGTEPYRDAARGGASRNGAKLVAPHRTPSADEPGYVLALPAPVAPHSHVAKSAAKPAGQPDYRLIVAVAVVGAAFWAWRSHRRG